jgi:GNAT superfamily N-acetyltransferase
MAYIVNRDPTLPRYGTDSIVNRPVSCTLTQDLWLNLGMKEISIRSAVVSDIPALALFRLGLRSRPGMNVETDGPFLKRCETWMTDALNRSEWRCWVAAYDDALVGALWLQSVNKIPNPTSEAERLAYITNFFVAESARGQGLGSRILNEALNWCRQNNVHSVILWPTEKSRTLYQRHGFDTPKGLLELTLSAAK